MRRKLENGQYANGAIAERKALQLCAIVRRTLSQFLSLGTDDEFLRSLFVDGVQPAPNEHRLEVTLCVPREIPVNTPELHLLLHQHLRPMLRSEITRSARRRRAPDLAFLLVHEPKAC